MTLNRKRFLSTGLILVVVNALVMILLGTMHYASAQPTVFGTNQIVNGDAEAGPGDTVFPASPPVPVPGWTPTGEFTAVDYTIGFGYPTPSDPGPVNRGNNFLTGGRVALSSSSQSIDVSAEAATIDSGVVPYDLSGFLGGFGSQTDNAVLAATFRDGSGNVLGSASIGPVTNVDRGNATGLLFRSTSGTVPALTRTIDILLTFTRNSGADNDGYADNLSLILTEPTISVDIDIKPGSGPNSINPRGKGVIPVAILGGANLDLDVSSLAFGPDGASPAHGAGHVEGDNLVVHFRTQDTGIVKGDTEACVTGETNGGTPIKGCDAIKTTGR